MKITIKQLDKLIEQRIQAIVSEKKIIKEYLINSQSKIKDIFDLNIFSDMIDDPQYLSKKLVSHYQSTAKDLAKKFKPYMNITIPKQFVTPLDRSWYDGSDAYDDAETQESELPGIYDAQIRIIKNLLTFLQTGK